MSKTLTATEFRSKLYRVLAELKTTGGSQLVTSDGCTFVVRKQGSTRKRRDLSKIPKRPDVLNCTFDELVAIKWNYEPKDVE